MQLSFSVWVTTACNLKCRYCYEGVDKSKLYLNSDKAAEVVDYIKAKANHTERTQNAVIEKINIGLHGGEPLLNFRIIKEFVNIAADVLKEYELSYQLTTNGTILDDEILSFLKDNIGHLTVSFDGDKATHDLNRLDCSGKGTYDIVRSNSLKLLKEFGNSLRIRMTFNSETVEKLYDNISHMVDSGFKIIIAQPDIFDKKWNNESVKALESEILKLKELKAPEDTYINLKEPVVMIKKGICSIESDGENIYPDGTIYGCTMATGNPDFRIGNIENGIDNSIIQSIMIHSESKMEKCSGCSFSSYCDCVRCRIINKIVNDDYCDPIGIQCALNNILIRCNGFKKR